MGPSNTIPPSRIGLTLAKNSASIRQKKIDEYIGKLNALLADDSVSEIMINRHDRIFVEKEGRIERAPFTLDSPESTMALANIIILWCGKERAVQETPIIDAMLPDGNRVTVILPPIAVDGPSISIRKFSKDPLTLDQMGDKDIMTPQMVKFLKCAAKHRVSILIAGNTSSGKTTLLNALSEHIGEDDRIVTIEDTPELRLHQQNVVRMETRDASVTHGHTGITPRDLIRSSLRIRPDRIIMGELRGPEAFDWLQAINTGHEGSMATIHANSPREAFSRLELLINMANSDMPAKFIRQQIVSSLNLVIQTQRDEKGQRRISHITEIVGLEGDVLIAQDLFVLKADPHDGHMTYISNTSSSRNTNMQKAMKESRLLSK